MRADDTILTKEQREARLEFGYTGMGILYVRYNKMVLNKLRAEETSTEVADVTSYCGCTHEGTRTTMGEEL